MALLGHVTPSPTLNNSVALVEFNHYYDDSANHIFDQIIFYEWVGEYRVQAWRLIKPTSKLSVWKSPKGIIVWLQDGEDLRKIYTYSYIETWTQYDPEMVDRSKWPENQRKGLLKRKR